MKNVDVILGDDARSTMQNGVDILANAVKATLGPRGRNAAIDRGFGPPLITKDGVTVARSITLENKAENMGAQLVKYVAAATNGVAGDGTTTATVLSQAIYTEGAKMVAAGYNPVLIKRGIDSAVKIALSKLKDMSIPIEGDALVTNVASISANNDRELGALISEAISAIGSDGLISVEEATGFETSVEYTEGFEIDRGYLSPSFINNSDRMTCDLENPYVLVCDYKISMTQDILPILQAVSEAGSSLVIIAKNITDEALATLVLNKNRGSLQSCAIKAPGFGDISKDMLEDIAILCGANFISESRTGSSLSSVSISDLGRARKIRVSSGNTTIVDGAGEKNLISDRMSSIKTMIEVDGSAESFQVYSWKERLSRLSGGVAVFKVGGATEGEMRERKDRVEDSINAVKAAIEEGVVPGGGTALLHCSFLLKQESESLSMTEEESIGFSILTKAMCVPFKQILFNAGILENECYELMTKVSSSGSLSGYDALNNCFVDNMVDSGIVDPLKVVRVALENSASACGTLLTTEVAIFNKEEDISK